MPHVSQELVKDRVALDLDAPQHVLHIIQWPSAAVAAARDALKAAEAQHARVFKTQDKTQGRAKRLADKLQAVAGLTDLDADDGDGGGGAAGGGIASHRSGVAVGDVDSANDADGDENVDEHHGQHRGSGRGGDRRDRECLSDQGMRPARLMTSGIIKGAGDTQPGGGSKVTVIDSISGIADEAERAQAAAARARLERHRLRVRDERRAALAGRMREERDALLAALTAAEAESTYSIGLSPAASAYWYSPTREKKVPSQLCRAAGKLREALIVSGLWGGSCLKPGLTAIDVGSAPGGWTQTLAACGAGLVVSIDPADMDPGVLAHPAVRHIKLKCQDAVSSGALAEHLTGAGRGSVDLVVCDVNAHPNDAVAMLTPVLPLLAPGGRLVLTLKTFGRGRGKEAWEAELVRLLGDGFERGTLLWLLANTPCERTYVAQRRA